MPDKQQVEVSFATPLVVLHEQAPSGPQPPVAVFTFKIGEIFTFKGASITMPSGQAQPMQASASMQVGTYATVSVEWHDKGGHPVKVDGPTAWVSSDPATVQVQVATGNPQIANLYAPGPVGSASIQATADADLGEGVKSVTATINIQVVTGQAIGGDITFTQYPGQGGTPPPPTGRPGR